MSNIKRKKKVCKKCQKERYIYARGMCQICYAKEQAWKTHKKHPNAPKKVVSKPAYGFTSQKDLFDWLWAQHDKKCPISKENLSKFEGRRLYWSCFAHILPKGLYTKYKLNPDNIMIVHPDVHTLYDQGTEEQRMASGWDFSPLFKARERLKQKYNLNE